MIKNISFILISLCFLQGCSQDPVDSAFDQKKLSVNKTTQYYWVQWPIAQKTLSVQETKRLVAYFTSKVSPKCHVRFASVASAKKKAGLMKVLKNRGFKPHQLAQDPFTSSGIDLLTEQDMQSYNDPNVLGLAIDTYDVIRPNCPDWSTVREDRDYRQSYSNFGCSHAQALASMVVDPKDLVKPFSSVQSSGVFVESSMKDYNLGKIKSGDSKSGTASPSATTVKPTATN